jgi:hypothetical protein
MKAETPATGIMKKAEFDNAVWYEVMCDCGSPDHNHSVWVEADEEIGEVVVHIHAESTTDCWTTYLAENRKIDNEFLFQTWWRFAYIINETIRRGKLILGILFRGYVKYESTVILNEQQALNYAETLKKSISNVKKLKGKTK